LSFPDATGTIVEIDREQMNTSCKPGSTMFHAMILLVFLLKFASPTPSWAGWIPKGKGMAIPRLSGARMNEKSRFFLHVFRVAENHQIVRAWGYARILSSAVTSGAASLRAVATMIRSAGSSWNSPGSSLMAMLPVKWTSSWSIL
jgi:hypothetical protein